MQSKAITVQIKNSNASVQITVYNNVTLAVGNHTYCFNYNANASSCSWVSTLEADIGSVVLNNLTTNVSALNMTNVTAEVLPDNSTVCELRQKAVPVSQQGVDIALVEGDVYSLGVVH